MAYKENDVNISFRVPKELRDKMSLRAEQLGMSVSKFLRNSMIKALEQGGIYYAEKDNKEFNEPVYPTHFRIPVSLYDEFTNVCEKQNVTKSAVMRQLIAQYIKDNK